MENSSPHLSPSQHKLLEDPHCIFTSVPHQQAADPTQSIQYMSTIYPTIKAEGYYLGYIVNSFEPARKMKRTL